MERFSKVRQRGPPDRHSPRISNTAEPKGTSHHDHHLLCFAAVALFVAVIGWGMILELADRAPPATDDADDVLLAQAIALTVF